MTDNPHNRMRLRYAGRCRVCAANLPQGVTAFYDRVARNVVCVDCVAAHPNPATNPGGAAGFGAAVGTTAATPATVTVTPAGTPPGPVTATEAVVKPAPDVDSGTAGASARREYDRRVAKREQRIRERHPKLGGLILALSDEPQSTTAWRTGATGEERLGRRLDGLAAQGVRALHDRRIPRTRANIDHIAISPAGVFVLDAKRYQGRPHLRVDGGILRPRTETLIVGSRRCDPLVDGMLKQLELVTSALERQGLVGIPVTGMLVFIDADWPIFGGDFSTRGVKVLWVNKALEHVTKPGGLTPAGVEHLHRLLASAFPIA